MRTDAGKLRLALTVLTLVALLLSVFAAVGWAAGTHSATEPTWYYRGVVTTDAGVKMKHITVVHDPLGLEGVTGNPKFMMWWGTSSPDQLFADTSNDGVNWSGTDTARSKLSVTFPSTSVPIYHPEVIYDRLGFAEKKSAGVVHFKMWFYDAGTEDYNWTPPVLHPGAPTPATRTTWSSLAAVATKCRSCTGETALASSSMALTRSMSAIRPRTIQLPSRRTERGFSAWMVRAVDPLTSAER
jgi:hypothetical protein